MPSGTQLSQLLMDLRAELGHSTGGAQGVHVEDTLKYYLRRAQQFLWVEYDWPRRREYIEVATAATTRYYDYPTDVDFTKVHTIYAAWGIEWLPLTFRITPADYSVYNSDMGHVADPPRKWDHNEENDQFEVWPVPAVDGKVLLEVYKDLRPLVQDTDTCTLDDTLIVMQVAAEYATRQKLADADYKIAAVRRYANRLLAQESSHKRRPFIMGGGAIPRPRNRLRPGLDYIPSAGT